MRWVFFFRRCCASHTNDINAPAKPERGCGGYRRFHGAGDGGGVELPVVSGRQSAGGRGRISGAGTATLTIAGVEAGDAGQYWVVVTDSQGQKATSQAAKLMVTVPGPQIRVLKPALGERVPAGQTYMVEWQAENIASPDWKLFLKENTVHQYPIFPVSMKHFGGGRWQAEWAVPVGLATGCNYNLWVKDDSSGVDDYSALFCIIRPSELPTETSPHSVVYIGDELPGTMLANPNGRWDWVELDPAPFSGARALRVSGVTNLAQLYFRDASQVLRVSPTDTMVAYVYLDPARPSRMVMLQFREGTSWEHRAYWGEDRFPYGANGPTSKVRMGDLPATGRWVRLEVPARVLGLEGKEVNGVALNVYDGDATFDHIGKVVPARDHLWVDDDVPAGSFTNFHWASAWNWTNANPTPFSGTRMHVMPAGTGLRTQVLGFPAADVLVGRTIP